VKVHTHINTNSRTNTCNNTFVKKKHDTQKTSLINALPEEDLRYHRKKKRTEFESQ